MVKKKRRRNSTYCSCRQEMCGDKRARNGERKRGVHGEKERYIKRQRNRNLKQKKHFSFEMIVVVVAWDVKELQLQKALGVGG